MDLNKLFTQGRAKSPIEPWSDEENAAVNEISQKTGVVRELVADYVRVGVLTVEDFQKCREKGIEPDDYKTTVKKAFETVKKEVAKKVKGGKKK